MRRISQKAWAKFERIVNDFQADAFQDELIWKRNTNAPRRFGENRPLATDDIVLKGLFQYNAFRVWPLTQYTASGEEDKQSEVIYLNLEYLRSLNLLDEHGAFVHDEAQDRFIHKGIEYESGGGTFVSQARDKPLLWILILKRVNGSEK
jgi:hypothetical protein